MSDDMSFKYSYTHEIVCPYCFHEFLDSWEHSSRIGDGDEIEVDCESCDKPFKVIVDIKVIVDRTTTYTSYKTALDSHDKGGGK